MAHVVVKLAGSEAQGIPFRLSSTGQLPVLTMRHVFGLQFVKLGTDGVAMSFGVDGFSTSPLPTYQTGDTVIIDGPVDFLWQSALERQLEDVATRLQKLQDVVTELQDVVARRFTKQATKKVTTCSVVFGEGRDRTPGCWPAARQ